VTFPGQVFSLDAAVIGGDAHAVSHVEERYTSKAIGDFNEPATLLTSTFPLCREQSVHLEWCRPAHCRRK